MNASDAAPASAAPEYPNRWLAMSVLLIANFMNMIDVTIVNVALPSLQSSLSATESAIEWVVAGYILAFALGLLPFGRSGDIYGKRRVFLIGVTAFTLASALCGFATSIDMLLVSRVIQGVAGAMMTPQILAIAQVMFPPKERAAAFALFGLTAGMASVAGPITGGFLIEHNVFGLEWRPIFLINLPIGILAVIAGRALIPDIRGNRDLTNDFVGIVLAAIAIFLLIFPLIEGRGFGWPAWCFAMMALSVPFAVAFVAWQYRQRNRGGPELLPVSLMTNYGYMLGAGTVMVFFSAMPGYFLMLTVFLQSGYGLGPLDAGLTTMPFPVGVLITSIVTGRMGGRGPRIRIALGTAILMVSVIVLRFTVSGVGESIERIAFIIPMFLGGVGLGLAIAPMYQLTLMKVPGRDAGSGSGALQAIQQMGAAFGVAIISEIFFATIPKQMAAGATLHDAFKAGFLSATWYNMCVYVLIAVAILALKPSAEVSGGRPAMHVGE